jgi:hypothetical protein
MSLQVDGALMSCLWADGDSAIVAAGARRVCSPDCAGGDPA